VVTAAPFPTIPEPSALTEGQISVATFNVENYFVELDDTGGSEEPKLTATELAIQQEKLAYALSNTLACPTVVGVQEVEKAILLETLAELASEACGFRYKVTHLESLDVRGIDVALLTNPNLVTVQGAQLRQACAPLETGLVDDSVSCQAGEEPLFSRPPLQVDLQVNGQEMTLFVNHFKSKREGETETARRRLLQAQHVAALVDDLLADDADALVLVLGDLNDYELSAPLLALMENGRLSNTLAQIPQTERYSFNFSGVTQLLDAILVSPALVSNVDSVQIFHTNADFPDVLGQDVSPDHIVFRATDHDLPLVVFALVNEEEIVVVETAVSQSTSTPIPPQAEVETNSNWWFGIPLLIGVIGGGVLLFWFRKRG
jgi:predicted extracellular nuclease